MERDLQTLREVPVEFTGTGREYFGVWVVNILLTILTLGVYSAWAKVRRRKYFYNNTLLDGSPFDYLAKPVAILKGWAIAVAVLVAYNLAGTLAPPLAMVILVVVLVFLPAIVVRALRFNLINTSYRNVRFSFARNTAGAARAYLLWPFLSLVTLGLAYPYSLYRQRQFVVDNSSYAQDTFTLAARGGQFYRLALKVIGVGLLATLALVLLFVAIGAVGAGLDAEGDQTGLAAGLTAQFLVWLVILWVYSYAKVRMTNLVWNQVQLGQHRFQSRLRVWPLFAIYLSNLLAIIVSLGLLVPWAQVRTLRYRLNHTRLLAAHDLDGYVSERRQEQGALGEELGEAFDIGIGL